MLFPVNTQRDCLPKADTAVLLPQEQLYLHKYIILPNG